jgi:hypothetical protein
MRPIEEHLASFFPPLEFKKTIQNFFEKNDKI